MEALLRPVTIAAWSFRREDYELTRITPTRRLWEKTVCWRVAEHGRQVAEADLAVHIGQDESTLGHTAEWQAGKPVNAYVEKWMDSALARGTETHHCGSGSEGGECLKY